MKILCRLYEGDKVGKLSIIEADFVITGEWQSNGQSQYYVRACEGENGYVISPPFATIKEAESVLLKIYNLGATPDGLEANA